MENESQRFTWKNLLGGVFGFSIGYALWHFTGSFALGVFFGLFFGIIGLFRGFGGVVGLTLGFSFFILAVFSVGVLSVGSDVVADTLGDASVPIVFAISFAIGGAILGLESKSKKVVLYFLLPSVIGFVILSALLGIIWDDRGGIIGLMIWGSIGGFSLGLNIAYFLTKEYYASKEDELVSVAGGIMSRICGWVLSPLIVFLPLFFYMCFVIISYGDEGILVGCFLGVWISVIVLIIGSRCYIHNWKDLDIYSRICTDCHYAEEWGPGRKPRPLFTKSEYQKFEKLHPKKSSIPNLLGTMFFILICILIGYWLFLIGVFNLYLKS